MSTTFEARFSATYMKIPRLLERLMVSISKCGLSFSTSEFDTLRALADAGKLGGESRGFGFTCVSDFLLRGLGRCDAVEVYLNILPTKDGRWTASYLESSAATDFRVRSQRGGQNLSELQAAVCEAGRFELSVYEEQNYSGSALPTVRNAEVSIKRVGENLRLGDLSVVLAPKLISYERGRKLAGRRADEVKVSDKNYLLFPFLAPALNL